MLEMSMLKSGISAINSNFPTSREEAAEKWSRLYVDYAKSSVSGVVTPVLDGVWLYSSMLTSMEHGKFMDDLGVNLGIFWLKSTWIGPSATGFVSYADGKLLQSDVIGKEILDKAMTAEQVADFLSRKLHEWTLTVQVTATVSSNVVVANIL